MAREGFVSWEAAQQALNEQIQLAARRSKTPSYIAAPYFVEHVRRFLEERYGGTAPYQLGLHVYTTCDLAAQRAAEQTLRKHIDEIDGHARARAADPAARRAPRPRRFLDGVAQVEGRAAGARRDPSGPGRRRGEGRRRAGADDRQQPAG